jgi:hypothetical protein
MGGAAPRRVLLAGLGAFASVSVASFPLWRGTISRTRRRDKVMRYEEGLAKLFERGPVTIEHMVLAHTGNLGDRLPAWLARAARAGQLDERQWWRRFEALATGPAEAIEAVLRQERDELPAAERADAERLDIPVEDMVDPMALLGRGDVMVKLHANALRRRVAENEFSPTGGVAFNLARAGDWTHAVEILEHAWRTHPNDAESLFQDRSFWIYAHQHRQIDGAISALAQKWSTGKPRGPAEPVSWKLKAYQIRAGMTGIDVPVIEGKQPFDYIEAAATQVAALDGDPTSAELVQRLRNVLQPQRMEMMHADRGFALVYDHVASEMLLARARIAASRKDHAKAADLARTPAPNVLITPASRVIQAFLEEGDWRGAADIAKEHDPRLEEVGTGLDDTRVWEFVQLYVYLAFAAAYIGDDAAAVAFLDQAEQVDRTEVDRDEDGVPISPPFLAYYTYLAGAAEGRLPRRYLHLLGPLLYFV